jgi:uncharacterized membrane protein
VGALESVDAGAFAVVMATGILGVGARLEGIAPLTDALLGLACLAWLVLAAILRTRSTHSFAVVAGTAVVGAGFLLAGQGELALALWSLAAALWLAVAFTIRDEAANSLLTIVATESLAVLAALLDRHHDAPLRAPAIGFWALGLALYPLVAGPILHRSLRERDFSPTLWVVMGALAITTLAAAELLRDRGTLGSDVALATWGRPPPRSPSSPSRSCGYGSGATRSPAGASCSPSGCTGSPAESSAAPTDSAACAMSGRSSLQSRSRRGR